MTKPVLAIDTPQGRRYVHPATGESYISVTTAIDRGIPKGEALIGWAAKVTARHAVDNWDSLGELHPDRRAEELIGVHRQIAIAAADKGDAIHDLVDSWAKGEPYDPPKEVSGFVTQFVNFMTAVRPVFLENEVTLMSRTHGYAGTADWLAEIDGVTCLGENKTSRGVYGEHALQLSALANCDFILREDGTEEPIPQIGGLMIAQIRPRSWKLWEVTVPNSAFKTFLAARMICEWTDEIADGCLARVA